jgi:hypothetical protein
MKFVNEALQTCYEAKDWTGLMKEADKISYQGKLPATSEGGVKLFPNGKLLITEGETFRSIDTLTFGGQVNGHRKVVANNPRRGLYNAAILLKEEEGDE